MSWFPYLPLAVIAALAGLAAVLAPRTPWAPLRDASARLTRLHAWLVIALLAAMMVAFLVGDLSLRYVWAHTDTTYPLAYRLAGLWGGEEGTLLLWSAGVAAIALVALRAARRAPTENEARTHREAVAWLTLFSTALLIVLAATGAFDATATDRLSRSPRGRGLADVLLTPLMVIHPPIQFVAYALVAAPAAYALAGWQRRHDETPAPWIDAAFDWARRGWLLATVGLGLGAIWAYYVLSFGGYWAWDPVEAGNLLPWLALTAFLHAGKQWKRIGEHAISAPLLAVVAFALTLFSTIATRSGLWVSVHAFTDPTSRFEPDPAARLLAIADVHLPTRMLLGVLFAALCVAAALFVRHQPVTRTHRAHALVLFALAPIALLDAPFVLGTGFSLLAAWTGAPASLAILMAALLASPFLFAYLSREDTTRPTLSVRTLLTVAVALLSIALAVTLALDLQVVNGPDRRVFDARAPFVALPIVAALTVMLGLAPLGKRGALILTASGVALGMVGALVFPDMLLLAASAPLLVACIVAAVLKLAHVQGRSAPPRIRFAGACMMLASILGLVMWSNPPTRIFSMEITPNMSLLVGAFGIAFSAFGLIGSVGAFRSASHRVVLWASVAATLAAGYGVGAVLGIVALAILMRERGTFTDRSLRHEGARLRETGIYLVHLALVIGLLGFAASTYEADRAVFTAVSPGSTVTVGPHAVTLDEPHVVTSGGRAHSFVVPLHLEDAGTMGLAFDWSGAPSDHYVGRLDVRRALAEDVYVVPLAFRTIDGWVSANGPRMAQLAPSEIEAVSFSVSVLPLMSFVWSGLSMMSLGMGLIIGGEAFARRAAGAPRSAFEQA